MKQYFENEPIDIVCQAESSTPITVGRYEKYLKSLSKFDMTHKIMHQGREMLDKNMIIDDSELKDPVFDVTIDIS